MLKVVSGLFVLRSACWIVYHVWDLLAVAAVVLVHLNHIL